MTLGITARKARDDEPLVGRADELAALEGTLDELEAGSPGAVALLGEAGIGKTRLLRELSVRAEQRQYLVLSGSASELERDLPFSAFVDALDEYVEGLDGGYLSALDDHVQAQLAHVFPSLAPLARGRKAGLQHERYRSHRAVRALLEQLAKTTPLVLALDDFHWADAASVELLGALLRRPPSAAVLIALALRPRQLSGQLPATLAGAQRAGALGQIELGTLSIDETRELLGQTVAAADASVLYEQSGGNPFYLEQLARSLHQAAESSDAEISLSGVPTAVVAALGEELSRLSTAGRLLLEGAAVAGDPFEPELAAAAAGTREEAAIDVLDELLAVDLVRITDAPRRFRFRHPLVRRAVYETAAGAWRLGAHERCAAALTARGASATARAHHIERSAREGDLAADAVLRGRARQLHRSRRQAPRSGSVRHCGCFRRPRRARNASPSSSHERTASPPRAGSARAMRISWTASGSCSETRRTGAYGSRPRAPRSSTCSGSRARRTATSRRRWPR
jgi:predicted ATPase